MARTAPTSPTNPQIEADALAALAEGLGHAMRQAQDRGVTQLRVRVKLETWQGTDTRYVYCRGGSWVQLIDVPQTSVDDRWALRAARWWTSLMVRTLADLRREVHNL